MLSFTRVEDGAEETQEVLGLGHVADVDHLCTRILDSRGERAMQRPSARGDLHEDTPAVRGVSGAMHDAVHDQAVDQAGQARRGYEGEIGDFSHRVDATVGEQHQRAPLLDRAVLDCKLASDLANDAALRATQRVCEVLHERAMPRLRDGHGLQASMPARRPRRTASEPLSRRTNRSEMPATRGGAPRKVALLIHRDGWAYVTRRVYTAALGGRAAMPRLFLFGDTLPRPVGCRGSLASIARRTRCIM